MMDAPPIDIAITVLIGIHLVMMVNVLMNLGAFTMRRRARSTNNLPSVSVLIPARNEEANLPRLLASCSQQDHPDAEFLIFDDDSDDATWSIIETSDDPRVKGYQGGALPEGWVGKTNGCYQLSLHARGDVLLFIDADTEFQHPAALRHMCERFAARPKNTMLTGMTLVVGRGRLIVTMVGTLIMSGIPWWLGRFVPAAAMSGVNGQCWMITRDDYRRLEPHRHVKGEVLEDIKIGRYLHRKGLIPLLDDVTNDLTVHMYATFADAWRGFQKNTADILGTNAILSSLSLVAFILLFIVAPVLSPILIVSLFGLKFVSDRITRQPISVSLLAPVSYVLTVFLALDSIWTRARGRIEWKGRIIP